MRISYAKLRKKFIINITISEWNTYERVMVMLYLKKNECIVMVIVIEREYMQNKAHKANDASS